MPDRFHQTAKSYEAALPGGVRFIVTTHVSTGTDPKTRPGVELDLRLDHGPVALRYEADGVVDYRVPLGVLDRDQVRAIRNLLTEFMLSFPENDSGA